MHELIQIWKKNASETNLKALNPIIGSFSVKVQVNLLIAYVPPACLFFFLTRHSEIRRPIRRFAAKKWQIGVLEAPLALLAPPPHPCSHTCTRGEQVPASSVINVNFSLSPGGALTGFVDRAFLC